MTPPGVPPVTIREIQAANRRLVSAMRKRKAARKAAERADAEYKAASKLVRDLLELSQRMEAPAPAVKCQECGAPMGKGATCHECSAVRVFVEGETGA